MVDDLIPILEETHLRFRSAELRLVLMVQKSDGTEQGPLKTGRQASRGPRDGSWEIFPGLRHGAKTHHRFASGNLRQNPSD